MKRNSEIFGQDPANISRTLQHLTATAQALPHCHWAALIDAAFDYPKAEETLYWRNSINCYGSVVYEGLSKAAPMLIPIDPSNDLEFLTKLLKHCHARPMISFLASQVSLEELCMAWEPLHWITSMDQQKMLLRFSDSRVLIELPQVLTPEQWGGISGLIAEWLVFDRRGNLVPLSVRESEKNPSAIHLNALQLARLLDASEPDNILALIATSMPEILPGYLRNSDYYYYVSQSCCLAKRFGVTNWTDVISLSVAAFLSEGGINKNGKLDEFLQRRSWIDGNLGESLIDESLL